MDFSILKELLDKHDLIRLTNILKTMRAADIAEFLEELDHKTALLVFRLLPKDLAVNVFSHLSSQRQSEFSMLVDEEELASIVEELYFDDRIDYIEEMPANVVKKILKNSSETERRLINQFLNYPEDSAGSLMTIEFVDLKKHMKVRDALKRIREIGQDKETIYTCYVIDEERRLEGIVSLRDLVLADPDAIIEDIMETQIIYVSTYDDQEYIADVFKKYGFLALPVVDQERRLVGIITVDDIVDVIELENTEDFHKMAAIQPLRESYLDTSVFKLASKRMLWLMVLMISATISGGIIKKYESALEAVVALTVFIPMLMDTGGNAGSQSSTLIIRSIALGELTFKDTFKVIWKEFRVSLVVGLPLAIVNFLRVYFLEGYGLALSLTVSATLLVTVIFAKIVGGLLPMIAQKLNIDPAIMASPLITTIVDAISLVFYFTFATWIMGL
ncbi:MAG TPA: magnesium transporter [Clostridiales bacterium]|nr:magnesium transporter [Clostridiales bacterium]